MSSDKLEFKFAGVTCSKEEFHYLDGFLHKGCGSSKVEKELNHYRLGKEAKADVEKQGAKGYCIGPHKVTKAQHDQWLTSGLEEQKRLEFLWNVQWRNKPEPVVANSVEATLAQRGSRYGDFTDHARVCQQLKHDMVNARATNTDGSLSCRWNELSDVQKQALEVIADKIARILTGDPNYDDNWHDIQGYAKLVEDRLPCNVNKETK